jgi:hypothetical protein
MSKTRTIEETIKRIEIKWEYDEGLSLGDMLDYGPQLNFNDRLDVEANIAYHMKDLFKWANRSTATCVETAKYRNPDGSLNMALISEVARLYTAQERQRVIGWYTDKWTPVICCVTAYTDAGREFMSARGGIESDCGKEYKETIENLVLDELFCELETEFSITREEFDALECEEAKDSYPIIERESDECVPIPALPDAPEGYTASYKYDYLEHDDTLYVILTCNECEEEFVLAEHTGRYVFVSEDEHADGTKHSRYCPLYPTEEPVVEEPVAPFTEGEA